MKKKRSHKKARKSVAKSRHKRGKPVWRRLLKSSPKRSTAKYISNHLAGFALFCFISLIGIASLFAPAKPDDPDDICAIFKQQPDWYEAAKASQKRYAIPIPVQMAIMFQESAFYHDARPQTYVFDVIPLRRISSAHGYSQALDGTWEIYKTATNKKDAQRTIFADAYDFMGWYNEDAARTLGLSRSDAYHLYLAYHDGVGGYLQKTYTGKAFLLKAAEAVKKRASRYSAQFKKCQRKLDGKRYFWQW